MIFNDPTKTEDYAKVNDGVKESIPGVSAVIQAGKDSIFRDFKTCQDRYLIDLDLKVLPRRHLFAIFDGHGKDGEEFAEVCRTNVRGIFNQELAKPEYNNLKDHFSEIFNEVFNQLNKECKNSNRFVDDGGTTGTVVVIEVNEDNTTNFYCAWKGHSRATYAFKDPDGSLVVKDFSTDHKPDTPSEREIIENKSKFLSETYLGDQGCYVTPASERGPSRLNRERVGLAMSRSIGDFRVSPCQPPNPEVKIYNEDKKPEYIILASDGIWEYINSQEAYV